jgi:hypothetical protein
MTLRSAYRVVSFTHPKAALGGRSSVSRPLIPVTFIGPGGTHLLEGLIASGADGILVPEYVATIIGLDLALAACETTRGIGGVQLITRYVDVTMRIADQNEQREWSALVGFAPLTSRNAILGHAGFLQYFTTILHGDLEFVKLPINPLYPGT